MPKRTSASADLWMKQLGSHLDLEGLVQNCCKALLELAKADRCSVMVLDAGTEELTVRWAHGSRVKQPTGQGLRFRMGDGLCGWVARAQKAYCTQNAIKEPRFVDRPARQAKQFRQVKTLCVYPLVVEGRTVGVVNLSSFSASRRFRWIHSAAGQRFLGQMAQAIAQVTLLQEAQTLSKRWIRQAKATSETVAQVSHEIRTPLTLIYEGSGQLLDGLMGELAPRQTEQISLIKRQSNRLLTLVTELLDLSRIEAGRLSLERKPLDLAEVVREASGRYESLVAPRSFSLKLGEIAPVYGDRSRLAQVVENLITNAVKFTPSHGSITVTLSARGRSAELAIHDTGLGIPKREQRRLFERFAQMKVPATLAARGTGLGLAIVKEVIQMHGGTIRVASKPGKGTSFIVSLPLYSFSFALTEEFRVMREQAAREGQALALHLLGAKGEDAFQPQRLMEYLVRYISKEDRLLEDPQGKIVLLSVLHADAVGAMRKRIEETLGAHTELLPTSGLSWGWALVPHEETTLPEALRLAKDRSGKVQGECDAKDN